MKDCSRKRPAFFVVVISGSVRETLLGCYRRTGIDFCVLPTGNSFFEPRLIFVERRLIHYAVSRRAGAIPVLWCVDSCRDMSVVSPQHVESKPSRIFLACNARGWRRVHMHRNASTVYEQVRCSKFSTCELVDRGEGRDAVNELRFRF